MTGTATPARGVVKELVFKGPARQVHPRRTGWNGLVWLALGLGGVALAVLPRLIASRRARKSPDLPEAGKEEPKFPPELILREPKNLPRETVMADKS